ncbi:unnamed protein product [Haemonchus placei]|uniref:C-type lectin domain-containing protein n=1 Tax=Haemonchus placei TaxID=6290 RepID=A0A0N4WES0_HAEPC|nr:unnamed protein product [Haemonchus placei]
MLRMRRFFSTLMRISLLQANFLPYAFSDIPNNHCVEVAIAILGPIPCSPYITNPKNGKCNRKYCDLQEAPSASEMCRYMGGELVTICDKDDNDLIAGLAILHPDHLDVLNSVWIGLVRNHIDRNQWEWLSGENCTYRSWFGSEPNDMGGNENHNFHYICEWDECPSQKNIIRFQLSNDFTSFINIQLLSNDFTSFINIQLSHSGCGKSCDIKLHYPKSPTVTAWQFSQSVTRYLTDVTSTARPRGGGGFRAQTAYHTRSCAVAQCGKI